MVTDEMLQAVRNYLDITFEDAETDKKLQGIIARGMAYLNEVAGTELDYSEEAEHRALLLDYCRYARNNVLELFEQNFSAELISLRIGVQTNEFAEQQGYI